MSAIHVVVRPQAVASEAPARPSALYGLFDVVVDGVNLTARIGQGQALALLGELARAVTELMQGRRARRALPLYTDHEAWELGLEADRLHVVMSVFCAGQSPEAPVDGRRVTLEALRAGVLAALEEVLADGLPPAVAPLLESAKSALERCTRSTAQPLRRRTGEFRTIDTGELELGGSAEFRVAAENAFAERAEVERSDLHSLLGRGTLKAKCRQRTVSATGVHLFLAAERLIGLAEEALDSWRCARPLFRRVECGELKLGVRRGPGDGSLAFTLGRRGQSGPSSTITFPELSTTEFGLTVADFCEGLTTQLVTHDPTQACNLRLSALKDQAARLRDSCTAATATDELTNGEPKPEGVLGPPPQPIEDGGRWEHGGKMRFIPLWVAAIPNVDPRSILLCDDRLVVSSQRETVALDRNTGDIVWRAATARAGCVPTAHGLARIEPDGRVAMHDLETGAVRFTARIAPRRAGGATGAVVQAPGLPKLLIVAEGDRQVTALDLITGELRWRHTARSGGAFRMRRAGRLVLVSGGDSSLSALDVTTGEVVWRARARLPFTGDMAVRGDAVFALSGGRHGLSRLHCFDAWSGRSFWVADLDERPLTGRAPLVAANAVAVPTLDSRGGGVCVFDSTTGTRLWETAPGTLPGAVAWTTGTGSLIANGNSGVLVCFEAESGKIRYQHAFSQAALADQPRRLAPQLRSGALFVPQHQVHVLRARTGETLGELPCDLVPDWIRVDRDCRIYVAEDSGHIAVYATAAQLTRVK